MLSYRSFLRTLAIALVLSTAALAQTAITQWTVSQPVVNMYRSASADSDVVSQAIYGTPVTVLEAKDGWSHIQTPDQYKGWVVSKALLAPRNGHVYASGNDNVVRVTSLYAHLYRETDVTAHAPLLTVPFDTRLEVVTRKNDRWLEVRLADGRNAWVQSGDVAAPGPPLTIDQDIALAHKFMGLPYTWGGTSSYGYDCSGFMQMLISHRGKLMPRDADIQAAWSGLQSVEKKDLQPGDLLYFGSSIDHITHTGMYIGDGKFIDATTHETPMVRIDNLNEPYWTKLLVAARRLK
jgi:cell wall-associated NlpC family hydrolase